MALVALGLAPPLHLILAKDKESETEKKTDKISIVPLV
jgi:hypothetical protein